MIQLITLFAQGLYILGMVVMSWHVVKYNPPTSDPAELVLAIAVILFWPVAVLLIGIALVLESFKENP